MRIHSSGISIIPGDPESGILKMSNKKKKDMK